MGIISNIIGMSNFFMGVPPFSSDYDPAAYAKKSADERGLRLHCAAQSGDLPMITALLESGNISTQDRGGAVIAVAYCGHLPTLTALLANGSIYSNYRNLAVASAARNGFFEIVTVLLENGPIHDDYRSLAAINAASRGYFEIVTALLEIGPIHDDDQSLAVIDAISHGHFEIVTALLENGPTSNENQGWTANALLIYSYSNMITESLQNDLYPSEYLEVAPASAARETFFKIAIASLSRDLISDYNLAQAVANPGIYPKILKVFEKYRFYKEQCTAIQTATQAGNTDVAKDLLAGIPLMSWQTAKLLTTAIDSKNLEIIEVILKSGFYIRPHDFGIVLDHAAASDDADITHRIFDLTFCSKRFSNPPFLQKILTAFPTETVVQLVKRSSHTQKKPHPSS